MMRDKRKIGIIIALAILCMLVGSVDAHPVTFTVTELDGTTAIPGAVIDISGGPLTTDGSGVATVDLGDGTYDYCITEAGHVPYFNAVTVSEAAVPVDVSMDVGNTVTFTVTETDGTTPIVGAEIVIFSQTLTTDGSGVATINLNDGDYYYQITEAGHVPFSNAVTISGAAVPVDVSMDVGNTVTFTVTELNGITPIAGAVIGISGGPLTTDGSGVATINLNDGDYFYDITEAGHVPFYSSVIISGAPVAVDVSMDVGNTVTFTVDDGTNPIAGASIWISSQILTTDAFGVATINLNDGDYRYTVLAGGYAIHSDTVTVSGAAVPVPITLVTGNTVTFTVTESGVGTPITTAYIYLYGVGWFVDGVGQLVIDLEDGTHPYEVTATGYKLVSDSVTVAGASVAVPVPMELAYLVTFTVTEIDGVTPIAGAQIVIDGQTLTTDVAGQATIYLEDGAHSYTVTVVGYKTVSDTVTVDGAAVDEDVLMELAYTVTFMVTELDGITPIAGAEIAIDSQTLTTDVAGQATIDLENGAHPYTVTAAGYQIVDDTVTVASGPESVPVTMTEASVNPSFTVGKTWGNLTVDTFSFTNTSTTNDVIATRTWYFDYNGPNKNNVAWQSTLENPTYSYPIDGTFDVVLNLTGSAPGSQPVSSASTRINVTPFARFDSNLTHVGIGQPIQFTNRSSIGNGTHAGYLWTFPDGTPATSVLQNPIASFSSSGSKIVSMRITNTSTSLFNTTSQTIQVADLPQFSIISTTLLEGVMPLPVEFEAEVTGTTVVDTWEWEFADGSPNVTGPNTTHRIITHAYDTRPDPEREYTVNLTGSSLTYRGANKTFCETFNIREKTALSVDFNWSPGYPGEATGIYPFTVEFAPIVTGDGILDCNWTFGEGQTPQTGKGPTENVTNIYAYDAGISYPKHYQVDLNVTSLYSSPVNKTNSSVHVFAPVKANFTYSYEPGLAPIDVDFRDESEGNPSSWSWNFTSGVPPTSDQQHPLVTFAQGGTFKVNLTATNPLTGSSDFVEKDVIIEAKTAPEANFTMTPDQGISEDTLITFDGRTSKGSDLAYSWDFYDGNKKTGVNTTTHKYTAPGTYYPSLTVTNAWGDPSQKQKEIKIGSPVKANFTYEIDKNPQPGNQWTINFTDTSTGDPDVWNWKFGDGSQGGTTRNVQHTYYQTGTYPVNLTVANTYYDRSNTTTQNIVISDKPIARFSASETLGSIPFTVEFIDNSVAGSGILDRWLWDFGDRQTSPSQSPSHTYTTVKKEGFPVTLTVWNSNGDFDGSAITYIYTYEPLVAKFSADPSTGVKPLTVHFTDESLGDPDRWHWDFDDGTTYTDGPNPPDHIFQLARQYTVNLTVYKDNPLAGQTGTESIGTESISIEKTISSSALRVITVTDVALPEVSFKATSPISGTAPLTVSFEDTTDPAKFDPIEWLWEFGDGAMSTEQNPTHTYEKPGMYTVVLNVKNAAGISRAANPVFIAVTESAVSVSASGASDMAEDVPAEGTDSEPLTGSESDIPVEE